MPTIKRQRETFSTVSSPQHQGNAKQCSLVLPKGEYVLTNLSQPFCLCSHSSSMQHYSHYLPPQSQTFDWVYHPSACSTPNSQFPSLYSHETVSLPVIHALGVEFARVVQAAVSGKANLLIFSIKIFDSVLLFGKC
jgi:hypothetical protein